MERLQTPPPLTRRRRSPLFKGVIASFATASLTILGLPAVHAAETDQSEALGRVINTDVLSLDLADAGTSMSGSPSDAGPNSNPLNVGVINDSVSLDLGTATLPLIGDENNVGLLHLGQAGALSSFASSPDALSSTASAGAVGEGGALDLDGIANGTYGSARVDLTTLLAQAGVEGLTDQIVDELSLELGALGSTATEEAGTVSSEYVVADGKLVISSPLVGDLSTELDSAVTGVGTTLNTAVGADGVLGTVAQNASIDLNIGLVAVQGGGGTIGITGLDAALADASDSLLVEPLTDANGLVSINLADGTIEVDLQQLGGADGLNGLPANTELLDSTTIGLITGAVSEALGTVSDRAGQVLVDDVFNNVGLTIELPARVSTLGLPAASVDIVVETTIGQLAGTAEGEPTVSIDGNLLGIIPIGTLLSAVEPVVQTVLIAPLQGVVGGLVETTTSGLTETLDGLIDPVLTTLDPVLAGVLSEVVSVTINEQPDPGYLGAESFTVNALSLELLPNVTSNGAVNVDLASSTVRAQDELAAPTITADPDRVPAGQTTVITGADYPANTEVTVQLTDASGADVGDPVTVTTDAEGGFTADLPVPAGTPEGEDYEVQATAVSGESASTPLAVIADDQADNTAENTEVNTADNTGENTEVNTEVNTADNTGENTEVNTEVNTADNSAENTEVNTADNTEVNTEVNSADNTEVNTEVNSADNTEVNTAENTEVNTEVNTADNTGENTEVNTADNTGENTEVNSADNTEVNTEVNSADNTEVNTEVNTAENTEVNTGENTEVNAEVNTAENTGENTEVNTGENTEVNTEVNTADNTADNAADNTADNSADNTADNTGDNTGDDATVEDPAVSVDPGSVEAGDSTTVTGENFPPNTEVDVQLVDADGNPVGDPVSVVTDENGDFTLDVAILDGTPAGEYTIVATAETGESASADLTVTGAGDGNGADNTSDSASDNTAANTGGGSNGTGGFSNGSSGSTGGSGFGSGGHLAQTGAAGTAAMVGLAALLLIGGAAGVMISRRSVS